MSPRSLLMLSLIGGALSLQAADKAASAKTEAELAKSTALPAGPLGQGEWRFEVVPGWAKLPPGKTFTSTHGGAVVDKAGNIYMSSDGPDGIFVFSRDGKFLRNIGQELTNMHGLMLREEDG